MTKTNSPQWVKLFAEVYDTFGNGDFTEASDAVTRGLFDSCRKRLAVGTPLTDAQRDKVVQAYQLRIEAEFEYTGTIALSRHQRDYARKTAPWFFAGTAVKAPELSEYVTRAEMQAAVDEAVTQVRSEVQQQFSALSAFFQQNFSTSSAELQHSFSTLSAHFQQDFSTDGNQRLLEVNHSSTCSSDFSTKLNKTKRSKTNGAHDEPITASRTPDEKPITPTSHPKEEEVIGRHNDRRDTGSTVSIFQQNAESAPTGNLEIDGTRYHLVFGAYEGTWARIHSQSDAAWRSEFDADLGAIARQDETNGARWTISPVFNAGDIRGYRDPLPNAVVMIAWQGSLIGSVYLVEPSGITCFERINFKTKAASSTLKWKGQPRIAQGLAA